MNVRNSLPVIVALAVLFGLAGSLSAAEAAVGKIKSVAPDKNQFVLTDSDGKDWLFTLKDGSKVRISDRDGKLDDLKAGRFVAVTYDKKADGGLFASAVRAGSPEVAVEGIMKGQLKSVDAGNRRFVLSDTNNKDLLITLVEKGHVWREDGQGIELNNLKAGDMVCVSYNRKDGGFYAVDIWQMAK